MRRNSQCLRSGAARALMIGLAGLSLAGCGRRDAGLVGQPLETLVAGPADSGWAALAPAGALVLLPPGAGRVEAVSERRLGDDLAQEIVLAGRGSTGRNRIAVAVRQNPAGGLGPGKPSEAGIRSEIATAFPGQAMRILPQPRQNRFGPYGLAIGAGAGGLRCIYAWQWLDREERIVATRLGGHGSWRVRLCQTGVTLDQIAAELDQLDLGPGVAMESGPALRRGEVRPPRPRKPQAVAAPAVRKPEREPAPVPAPNGGRYLAPVAGVPAALLIPQTAPAGSARPALDASLPAEAYRGPTARTAARSPLAPAE